MNGRIGITLMASALLLAGGPAMAERFFVTGHGGWVDISGHRVSGVGFPFKGGPAGSVEAGFRLFGNVSVSGEYGPYAKQPTRGVPEAAGITEGAFRATVGQIRIGMEPIENLRPYFFAGGGMSRFRTTYAGAGKIFTYGGVTHLLKEESVKAVTILGGVGFNYPLRSWLDWGIRTRYLYNRWQSLTDLNRPLSFPKGDGFSVDANLTVDF
jgi:hypothetical protein